MDMYEPKVSIIVTTYNSIDNFKKTYFSIKEQSYNNLEIIVVDGGSTDGIIDKLKDYQQIEKNKLLWISEKDDGIYDAMNKGLKIASGEWILFFNDIFTNKYVITKLVKAATGDERFIGAHGDLIYSQNGVRRRYWKMGSGTIKDGWMPAHPTLLLKKDVFEKYGFFKTDYKCSGDYEFMVRVFKNPNNELAYIPEILVTMFYGGTSSNGLGAYWLSFVEACRALKENQITCPYWVSLKRAFKVFKQFFYRLE